jgi:transcriptional regulator of acetoin/glycerol metabolism
VVGVTQESMAALMLYDWPGNIRELENAIEYAFVICRGELIQLQHLPEHLIPKNGAMLAPMGLTLREAEERTIRQALQRNGWKKMVTARELGIDKNTLRRKIKRFGISAPNP